MSGMDKVHRRLLLQAPVEAMDVDGLKIVVTGTAGFALASVLTALFYADLSARGDGWWLGVCLAGTGLGLFGLVYCWNRRRHRRAGDWTGN